MRALVVDKKNNKVVLLYKGKGFKVEKDRDYTVGSVIEKRSFNEGFSGFFRSKHFLILLPLLLILVIGFIFLISYITPASYFYIQTSEGNIFEIRSNIYNKVLFDNSYGENFRGQTITYMLHQEANKVFDKVYIYNYEPNGYLRIDKRENFYRIIKDINQEIQDEKKFSGTYDLFEDIIFKNRDSINSINENSKIKDDTEVEETEKIVELIQKQKETESKETEKLILSKNIFEEETNTENTYTLSKNIYEDEDISSTIGVSKEEESNKQKKEEENSVQEIQVGGSNVTRLDQETIDEMTKEEDIQNGEVQNLDVYSLTNPEIASQVPSSTMPNSAMVEDPTLAPIDNNYNSQVEQNNNTFDIQITDEGTYYSPTN